MKAVILAGGLGTRLSEETIHRPKPMVEIGGKPMLWHIMKMYSKHGINDFIVCCGYMGYLIKEYFANYFLHTSDITFDLRENSIEVLDKRTEAWRVTLVDTGEQSMTGGRLLRVAQYLREDDVFCFTYGDGVSDLDISDTIAYHRSHGRLATLTAAVPPGRFGLLDIHEGSVTQFNEKPAGDGAFINGGFFVLSPGVLNYLEDDSTVWEQQPLMRLAADAQLMAYEHHGFWQCMDTARDLELQERLLAIGEWLSVNGAAIHGSRPHATTALTTDDGRRVRLTVGADGATYAIVLGASAGGRVAIDALPAGDVTVLGHGPVARDGATVEVPSLPAAAVTLRLA